MIRIGVGCLLGFLIIDITVVGGEPGSSLSPSPRHGVVSLVMDLSCSQSVPECVLVSLTFWLCWPACCNSISAPPTEAVVAGGLAGSRLSPHQSAWHQLTLSLIWGLTHHQHPACSTPPLFQIWAPTPARPCQSAVLVSVKTAVVSPALPVWPVLSPGQQPLSWVSSVPAPEWFQWWATTQPRLVIVRLSQLNLVNQANNQLGEHAFFYF